jgi:hypothetical protein
MEIDLGTRLARQVEQEVDLLDTVLAGPFVVRDPADHVAPESHRLAHQALAVGERQDPVLGEGDESEVDDVGDLVAELEERPERDEVRVAHVDVAADEPGPLSDLPEDGFAGPRLDVLVGQERLPLGPREDALDQGARFVVPRLPDRQHRVHVDMRVDERRRD